MNLRFYFRVHRMKSNVIVPKFWTTIRLSGGAQRRDQATKNGRFSCTILADKQIEAGLKLKSSLIKLTNIGQGEVR